MSDNKAQKAASLLGLAKRAGKITSGVPLIIEALRSKKQPSLVVASASASENSLKKISDKCKFYGVELIKISLAPSELAHAVGRTGSVAAVAVNDGGLADLVRSAID